MYWKKISQSEKDIKEATKRIVAEYVQQKMALEQVDLQNLNPSKITNNILIPRQKMYATAITAWIKDVFLPGLSPALAEQVLIFGLGRIFSKYNDTGVQYCTDADLNFVLPGTATAAERAELKKAIDVLKGELWDQFEIILEVNPAFTIRTEKEIKDLLKSQNPVEKLETQLFYKCNERTITIIHDNPVLCKSIFSGTNKLSDGMFFQHFLGNNPTKPTITKLYADVMQLDILNDNTQEKNNVRKVIGSKKFADYAKQLTLQTPRRDLFPSTWYFSIKYTVNRVYDYVSSLLWQGYALQDIGFSGELDPDYVFLCNTHRLMLYLQEIIHQQLDSFNVQSDYTYMSAQRFNRFALEAGTSFQNNFKNMVVSGKLLLVSQKNMFDDLLKYITDNNRERTIERTELSVRKFIEDNGLHAEFTHIDGNRTTAYIPYTWADLGYFVFNAIANRMLMITMNKLFPASKQLGQK